MSKTHAFTPATPTASTRVFPSMYDAQIVSDPITVPLSILDATVARFAPTCATWLFPPSSPPSPLLTLPHLTRSLSLTLSSYPHLAGSLHMAPPTPPPTIRINRPQVTYSAPSDPGVHLIHAHSPHTIDEIVPASRPSIWDATHLTKLGLLPPSGGEGVEGAVDLALSRAAGSDAPSVIIQITDLSCGGLAIAIKFAHPLADAQTLSTFAHDWARINRTLSDSDAPLPMRPFTPHLLDAHARPGPVSDHLKRHKFDYYASSTPACPPFMLAATVVPDSVASLPTSREYGTPIPWEGWDWRQPVSHKIIRFSSKEVERIWVEAGAGEKVSKLDALFAHIWASIVQARQLRPEEEVHLNLTLGARSRVSPPLGDDFLGSPLFLLPVSMPSSDVTSALPELANRIRETLLSATPPRVAALLAAQAAEPDPSRYWDAFLGSRHTIFTSWARLGMYDVSWGGDEKARLVDGLMPEMDGIVQITEAGAVGGGKKWWEGEGVDVSLHLEKKVMGRVVSEEGGLRRFA